MEKYNNDIEFSGSHLRNVIQADMYVCMYVQECTTVGQNLFRITD